MSKDHVKAGGILPYTHIIGKDGHKRLYFLVGNDKKNLLSDFGGKMEKDEDIFDTCAREYYEESSGLLGSLDQIKKDLKSDAVRTHFVVCKCYKIYLLKINYNADLPKQYDCLKKEANKSDKKIPSGFFEMRKLKWISSYQLLKKINDKTKVAFRLMIALRVLQYKYGKKLSKL